MDSRMELSRLGSRLKLYLLGVWLHSKRQTMALKAASFLFSIWASASKSNITLVKLPLVYSHTHETSATIQTTDSQQIPKSFLQISLRLIKALPLCDIHSPNIIPLA